jgi:hypothetical protein
MQKKLRIFYFLIIFIIIPRIKAQSVSSGVVELRVPIWSLINLNERDLRDESKKIHHQLNINKYFPGKELTIEFKNGDTCTVEVSRVQDSKLLTDISECDHVLEITQLIPKGGKLVREYAPIWYRPISEQERQKFPLDEDSPLIVGRLPSQDKIKVLDRTNYKALFRNKYQHWYKIQHKLLTGWLASEELNFEENNTDERIAEKLNRIKIKIIKDKRKYKFSPGFLLDLNYQARLNNISEEDMTSKNKLGYVQNSFMTIESHFGYIRHNANQHFTGTIRGSYNNSNDGTKVPISYSLIGDIASELTKDFVLSFGAEYESLPTFNVHELVNNNSIKKVINNNLAYLHIGLEKKIFSLTDIATELGLHRSPMAKSLFSLLDHSFYFKIRGSYLVWDKTDHTTTWQGMKIYSEITSKIFNDFIIGVFYQMTSLKGTTTYAGQQLGLIFGYSLF